MKRTAVMSARSRRSDTGGRAVRMTDGIEMVYRKSALETVIMNIQHDSRVRISADGIRDSVICRAWIAGADRFKFFG
jgi:hypothetical protein